MWKTITIVVLALMLMYYKYKDVSAETSKACQAPMLGMFPPKQDKIVLKYNVPAGYVEMKESKHMEFMLKEIAPGRWACVSGFITWANYSTHNDGKIDEGMEAAFTVDHIVFELPHGEEDITFFETNACTDIEFIVHHDHYSQMVVLRNAAEVLKTLDKSGK